MSIKFSGLSSSGREKIEGIVETFFDKMIYKLLGYNPNNKRIEFFVKRPEQNAVDLFLESLKTKPNENDLDLVKKMVKSGYGYLSALRDRTKTAIGDKIDAAIGNASMNNSIPNALEIQQIVGKELEKAKNHFNMIAVSETTRAKNLGNTMRISKMGAAEGEDDPNVFFIVKRDSHTCKWCLKNHLHPDGTPKVFKLSEVKQGYLDKGEKESGKVSIYGAHVRCRCQTAYVGKHFGFRNGKLEFISFGHDEYKAQKEKYEQ